MAGSEKRWDSHFELSGHQGAPPDLSDLNQRMEARDKLLEVFLPVLAGMLAGIPFLEVQLHMLGKPKMPVAGLCAVIPCQKLHVYL